MRIQRCDVIVMDGNAGGVWNIDREHCAPTSGSFLTYKAEIHGGRFMRAWIGSSILQNYPFA